MPVRRSVFCSYFLGLSLLIAGMSCRTSPARGVVRPITIATPRRYEDERAIYARALQTLFFSGVEKPALIVTLDSLTQGLSPDCYGPSCRPTPAVDSHVEASALRNYQQVMRERGVFPAEVPSPARIRTVSQSQLDSFPQLGAANPNSRERNEQPPIPFWDEFRRRYPEAWGLTTFSRIGFNDSATQALLQVRHGCGPNCSYMESMFFEKRYGNWMLESRFPESAQDWIGQGNLRYSGPDARARQRYFAVRDAAEQVRQDSLLRDRAPRRIRGVVNNQQVGRPLRLAQVFVRSHSQLYGDSVRRIVTDSAGRFDVRDSMIGGTTFEVQCPGPEHRDGKTLAIPALYVFPAIDTLIQIDVPNLSPCWLPRKIHRIDSGELESDVHRKSSFPSAEEALVYESALRHLYPRRRERDSIVVSASTERRCAHYDCDIETIPRLARVGLVDSATIIDFSRKALEVVPISRIWSQHSGLHLITPGERAYLTSEGWWISAWNGYPDLNETGLWAALARSHFRANTIVSLTRIGWNARHSQALVRITQERGGVEERTTLLMQLRGKQWIALPSTELAAREKSVDITGTLVGDRCVQAKAGTAPTLSQLSEVRGKYRFTLVTNPGERDKRALQAVFVPDTTGKATRLPMYSMIDIKTGLRSPYLDAETHFSSSGQRFQSVSGMMMFDGSQTYLTIKTVASGALFGSWGSSSFGYSVDQLGNQIPDPSGYFCATLVEP